MLENLEAFKEHSSLPIKVIATLEGVKAAVSFVNMVRYFGWQPQVNHADGAYVFPAATTFRGVIIRYRESKRAESYPVYRAVCELVDSPETIFFPEDDAFNFVQVEIGDVPEYYRGAPGSF
jgi:hypothetical protein